MNRTLLSLTLLLLPATFGCGGPENRAEVRGTVRLNGELLATGSISFVPAEGVNGPASGGLIADGKYRVARAMGVAVGKNRVSIRSVAKTGRKVAGLKGDSEDERRQVIPAKYNERTELICTIHPGSNEVDFDLRGPPPGK
jgi:hypothetical protein